MKPFIYPPARGSDGAKALAKALGCSRLKHEGPVGGSHNALIVNWGNSVIPRRLNAQRLLNNPMNVTKAVNKLTTFKLLRAVGVSIPEFTEDIDVARGWAENNKVVCRTMLRGSEGRGIVISGNPLDLVHAPLYVKFFGKKDEYRVHVFNALVIDVQQKKLRNGYKEIPNRSEFIRNTANGWIFARDGIAVPDAAKQEAIRAVSALGLDFGAVDLAVNNKGQVVVFEINTAPGLEGTTVDNYANAIRSLL